MIRLSSALVAACCAIASAASAQAPNKVAGTWRPVSAAVEMNGRTSLPYGPQPQGKLVFTGDLHFVEFLHDPRIPRFKSNVRGEGTDAENRAALAGALALYGRYTVDAEGDFSGNVVEGSSFPNWIGDVRTTKELKMEVAGDRMVEHFERPGGAKVTIVWERLR
jgi:hypothetical protein